MEFVNLTPHLVRIFTENEVIEIPPSGEIARVQQEEIVVAKKPVPMVKVRYASIQGLPEAPEQGKIYIVSLVVVQALQKRKDWTKWRFNIVTPNTGPTTWGAKRDENGRIEGVRSLIVYI